MLKTHIDQVQTGQPRQIGPPYRPRPMNQRQPHPQATASFQLLPLARPESVRTRLNQYASTCRPGCHCACHASRTSATPAFVDRVLGKLFIGYTGLPLLSTKCDVEECKRSQVAHVEFEYWFPLGFFWSRIFRLQASYQANIGPQMSLSTFRRIAVPKH